MTTKEPMNTTGEWKEEFDDKFLLTEEHRSLEGAKNVDFNYVLGEMPKVRRFIEQLLASQRARDRAVMEKAFGNCTKCYGKGYSTQLAQLVGAEDFGGEGFTEKPKVHINLCSCDRGSQLKKLLKD